MENQDREDIIRKIQEGCYIKAIREMYVKLYKEREYYKLSQGESIHMPLQKVYNEVIELRKHKSVSNIKTDYLFVTINADEKISEFNKFVSAVKAIERKSWVNDILYVIEQRGKNSDEIGKGYHAHLLIHRNGKSFSKFCKEILSTCYSFKVYDKQTIEDFYRDHDIPYRYGPFTVEYTEPEHLKNRISYMTKQKKITDKNGEYNEKDIKQQYDKPFRERNNLKDYYIKGQLFEPFLEPQVADA